MATRAVSDLAIHPGEHLREELAAREMSQTELAGLMSRPVKLVNDLCRERKTITADTALDLEVALGIPAETWLGLQQEYELTVARNARAQRVSA